MRYLGGKEMISGHVAHEVERCFTPKTKMYIEPFCGSCAIIRKVNFHTKIASDAHQELIAMFNKVKEGWSPPALVTEEFYQECKDGKHPDYMRGYVGFQCSFAGKWFGGFARSKKGVTRDFNDESRRWFINRREDLKRIEFFHRDYKDYLDMGLKDCVIYCDPPYKNTTGYKGTKFDHGDFYDWCRELSKENTILVSEYEMPEDFTCVWEKMRNLEMTNDGRKRLERLYIMNDPVDAPRLMDFNLFDSFGMA